MNTILTVLIMLLKIVGVLLLALLAVLLAALLLPVGARVRYAAGALTVEAGVGPVRVPVWPRPPQKDGKKDAASQKEKKKAAPVKGDKASAAGRQPAAAQAIPAAQPAAEHTGAGPTAASAPGKVSSAKEKPAKGENAAEPAAPAPNRRVQALLGHLREDPLGFLEAMLAHAAFTGGRLLRGIHIRHLTVYWTVTAKEQDAAATAIQYGQQIALLNNLLVRAREQMDIRADSLWLQPDFTGELAGRRMLAYEVTLRPMVVVLLALRLLLRLLREPHLKGVLL